MADMTNIGKLIKDCRKEKGLSLKIPSKLVGLNPSTIVGYEAKSFNPSLEISMRLAETLGFSLDELEIEENKYEC